MTTTDIEFAAMLPRFGDYATPSAIRRMATTVDEYGFDAAWFADHVTFPSEVDVDYPFSSRGDAPFESTDNAYDLFQVLAHVAGITDSVAIGSNVCIAGYRHPVTLTKHAFTLDALSDGQFEFGIGAGWLKSEFEVLDVPFEERGSRFDEFLDIYSRALDEGEFSFDGPHHQFQSTGFYPQPDGDGPTLWIGGDSPPAYRRVAEHGDGWTIVWKRPDAIAETRETIMERWRANDRSGEPGIALMRPVHVGTDRDSSRPLIGTPDEIIDDIEAYADVGTTRIVLDFFRRDLEEQLTQVERFGEEVIPSF